MMSYVDSQGGRGSAAGLESIRLGSVGADNDHVNEVILETF